MTSCFCLQGEDWPGTAFTQPSAVHMHAPICTGTIKGPRSFGSQPQERQEIKQPQHTRTHTQAWNEESTRGVTQSHKATFYVHMPACEAAAASLASLSACTTTLSLVLGTVPRRPWLLLGGLGKWWSGEEPEIALSARS